MGGEDYTVFGLSGVGDTFGTCFGPLSRNRMVRTRLPLPLNPNPNPNPNPTPTLPLTLTLTANR